MDSYDTFNLEHEALLLIVTSTFGNGDPPENGEAFARQLQAIKVTGDTTPDIETIKYLSLSCSLLLLCSPSFLSLDVNVFLGVTYLSFSSHNVVISFCRFLFGYFFPDTET